MLFDSFFHPRVNFGVLRCKLVSTLIPSLKRRGDNGTSKLSTCNRTKSKPTTWAGTPSSRRAGLTFAYGPLQGPRKISLVKRR